MVPYELAFIQRKGEGRGSKKKKNVSQRGSEINSELEVKREIYWRQLECDNVTERGREFIWHPLTLTSQVTNELHIGEDSQL